MIRWFDYNDCWFVVEWGYFSDNLGVILVVVDWIICINKVGGNFVGGKIFIICDVFEVMIKVYEIQGCFVLFNLFNKVGLDYVVFVKVVSMVVVSKMFGFNEKQIVDVIIQVWVDGQSLCIYCYIFNIMFCKLWVVGDVCQCVVNLVLKVFKGESGVFIVFFVFVWGFYDVFFKGKKFEFQCFYGSYVMENVLFKVFYFVEFYFQIVVEVFEKIYVQLKVMGKFVVDIKEIICRIYEVCVCIIDKQFKFMDNFVDCDYCIQYMCFVMFVFGCFIVNDYVDGSEVVIFFLVEFFCKKIKCVEDFQFIVDYYDFVFCIISNGFIVEFNDGIVFFEVVIEVFFGYCFCCEEVKLVIMVKYKCYLEFYYSVEKVQEFFEFGQNFKKFEVMEVD